MDRTERQRTRLEILITEAGGTHELLAERIGTATSYISQLKTARNGIARKFCVRLEQGMGKPDGWMDQWLPEEIEGNVLRTMIEEIMRTSSKQYTAGSTTVHEKPENYNIEPNISDKESGESNEGSN